MATWTLVEGRLTDGLPMRMYLAENESMLWHASMNDAEHPHTEDEFVWRLGKRLEWRRMGSRATSNVLSVAAEQIGDYFAGRRLNFDIPLSLRGTPFQVRVWKKLMEIPFGGTRSYGEIAELIENPAACRAVGSANGRNNLPIFVPCHRVLAAGGKLGGFTGGIGLKKRLLAHEASVLNKRRAA